MGFGETLAQALRLLVLVLSYALERARAREERIADWRARRALFDAMVLQALDRMRRDAEAENATVDVVDDAVDRDLDN